MSSSSATGSSSSALVWLFLATVNNMGVTLLNKAAFANVNFPYPYFLSAVHMCCNALGCRYVFYVLDRERRNSAAESQDVEKHQRNEHWLVRFLGQFQRQELDSTGTKLMMLAFSIIFSLNIAIGNASLQYVSVNFNQVMRSLVPAMTIAMGLVVGRATSLQKVFAVIPVIVGVAMACFGDMSYTMIGLFYTIGCVFLAALKVVASGEILTGRNIRLHPVDLLGHMAPLALAQCLFMSVITGEVASIRERWATDFDPTLNPYPMFVVWLSGALSFSLNISSLQATKLTSPLTMCIAGNVKQVMLIILSTVLFHVEVTPLNAAGIVTVLVGSAGYSYVSILEKMKSQQAMKSKSDLESDSTVSTVSSSTSGEDDEDFDEEVGCIVEKIEEVLPNEREMGEILEEKLLLSPTTKRNRLVVS